MSTSVWRKVHVVMVVLILMEVSSVAVQLDYLLDLIDGAVLVSMPT